MANGVYRKLPCDRDENRYLLEDSLDTNILFKDHGEEFTGFLTGNYLRYQECFSTDVSALIYPLSSCPDNAILKLEFILAKQFDDKVKAIEFVDGLTFNGILYRPGEIENSHPKPLSSLGRRPRGFTISRVINPIQGEGDLYFLTIDQETPAN